MKIIVSPDVTSSGKFVSTVRAFPKIWSGTILDVGCRSRQLKDVLPVDTVDYVGVDLYRPADVIGNLGIGLPFDEASFDTIVALDVLEHTDDIHKSFAELCRVARTHVLLCLPNLYDVKSRKRFFFGQRISGKYGLPVDPPTDRHRWLFSFRDALTFTHIMAIKCRFEVKEEGCLIGPRGGLFGLRRLVGSFPNLLSPWYIALLRRTNAN
jgi:SAM-dependent methyltransferase